jgi:hypothetical protein
MLSISNGASNVGVPEIGTDFLVATVELLNDSSIRIWYTRSPALGTNKANDSHSYSIVGPNPTSIKLASTNGIDSRSIDLSFVSPLIAGQYTLSFNSSNIVSNDTDSLHLASNTQYVFNIVNANKPNSDLATDINLTKKFLNPAFLKRNQPNWEATVATLEENRTKLTDTVNKIFDQCFISTASDKYLVTRAADYGISHPTILGLADDVFRKLAITVLNDKLTLNANLDLLDLLYGTDATRANITSANVEPYRLFDGATLNILVDQKLNIPVVFSWSDFVNSLIAKAEEVCFVINKFFRDFNSTAFAVPYTDEETNETYIKIYSGTKGLHSSIAVTSGSAQLAFQFDNLLFDNIDTTTSPGISVTITDLPLNKASVAISQISPQAIEIFQETLVGDYINIIGSQFNVNNRGSFVIEAVDQDNGLFTITNKTAVTETVSPSSNNITIYHPVVKQIFDNVDYAYIANNNYQSVFQGDKQLVTKNGFSKASIPVNTEIVSRTNNDAAYLPTFIENTEISIYRRSDGQLSTTISYPSNSFIEITEFLAKLPVAADFVTSAGTSATPSTSTGTSDSSMFSRTFADTYLSSSSSSLNPLCVADLKGNVAVIGGWHESTDTGLHSISVCKFNSKTVDSNLNSYFNYTWTTPVTKSGRFCWGSSAVVIDYPRFWNNILIVGGYPNGTTHVSGFGYAENQTCLYNADTNTYKEITGSFPGYVADAALIWMENPYNKAVIIGGNDNSGDSTTKCFLWDPSYAAGNVLGQWYSGAGTELKVARSQCQGFDLGGGRVLVIGGRAFNGTNSFTPTIGFPINSCEIIQPNFGFSIAPKFTAPMGYKRFAFGSTKLPDGRILVVGGIGYKSNETVSASELIQNHELSSCEVYDPVLGIWYPIPDMLEKHSYCSCHYDPNTNGIYVCGGAKSTAIEYLKLDTMTWHYSIAKLPQTSFRGTSTIVSGTVPIVVRPNGSVFTTTEAEAGKTLFISLYNETARGSGINGVQQVVSSTKYQSTLGWTKSDTSSKSFTVTSVPETNNQIGSYIYDPNQIFGISDQELTTAAEIPRGKGCPAITVNEDLSNYPKTGFIVVHFGYKDQAGPINYSVIDTHTIILDPAFTFHTEFSINTVLTLATQKAPYLPDVNTQIGGLLITASNAGLEAAKEYITDISAAGLDLIINVRYPGDRGLGNEGKPVEQNYKLSDIIELFGPDDLDTFLNAERNDG